MPNISNKFSYLVFSFLNIYGIYFLSAKICKTAYDFINVFDKHIQTIFSSIKEYSFFTFNPIKRDLFRVPVGLGQAILPTAFISEQGFSRNQRFGTIGANQESFWKNKPIISQVPIILLKSAFFVQTLKFFILFSKCLKSWSKQDFLILFSDSALCF